MRGRQGKLMFSLPGTASQNSRQESSAFIANLVPTKCNLRIGECQLLPPLQQGATVSSEMHQGSEDDSLAIPSSPICSRSVISEAVAAEIKLLQLGGPNVRIPPLVCLGLHLATLGEHADDETQSLLSERVGRQLRVRVESAGSR
eukprot:753290-Hanusia_phi.AAC.6